MKKRQTHTKQAGKQSSNQPTNESMNNKQTNKQTNQTWKQASKQSDNQTIENQQSCPFTVHITRITAVFPSTFYALYVMEGIYGKSKKDFAIP